MLSKRILHYSLILSLITIILFLAPFGANASPQYSLGWVGNMWPTGGSSSTINFGDTFAVYVQVWKGGVTDSGGQGANITCTLHWGQVSSFGGGWSNITDTPMVYNTDIGSNDEYRAIIAPAAGLYEFTAFCTDTTDGTNSWQSAGNGMLTVVGPVSGDVDWASVLHDTFNTDYRNPGGAVAAGSVTSIRLRLRVAQSDVTSIRVRVWDDRTNTQTYYDMAWDAGFDVDPTTYDYWYADIPVPAQPTILYYFFEINDNTDQDFYTDDNPQFYGGGYGAMSDGYDDSKSFQITVYDGSFSVPSWIQRGVVYQIFPDRFRDGDTSNDPAAGEFFYGGTTISRSNDTDWNTVICDPRSAACPSDYSNNFYGGDLVGITEKINAGYFDQLGVTVLYLNPIFSSPSNHKYDTADYMTIDPDFGSLTDFQDLVAAADAHGIRIILDGVFNHTSSDSTYFDYYSRYDADGNLSSGDDNSGACEGNVSLFYTWYYFQTDSFGSENGGTCYNGLSDALQNYRAWYGYGSLPKLQANSTQVRDLIWANGTSSVGPYWVSQGASGWRFDVGGDVDPGLTNDPTNDYWEGFRSAVLSVDSSTVTLGEEWGDASAWLLGNEWDSVMNYRYRSAVLSWLFTGCSGDGCTGGTVWQDNDSNVGSASGAVSYLSPSQFNARLLAIQEDYPEPAWKAMMNLGDSHDTNRLRFVLRQINNGNDAAALQRMRELWLFAFTYAGAPTVYYGDEVGLSQDGVYSSGKYEDDPYNRAPFPWDDTTGDFVADTDLQDFIRTMSSIRQSYRALQDGDVVHGIVLDDASQLYGYARVNGSQTALVVLNRSGSAHDVTLSGLTAAPYNLTNGTVLVNALDGSTYTVSGGAVTVSVNPTWGVVLLEQDEIETPAAPADLSAAHIATDVTLSWDIVSRDTDGGVEVATSYTVYGSTDAGFTPDSSNLLDTIYPPSFGSTDARVSYTDSAHTGYFYAVCAVNAAGNENCTALPVYYDYGDLPDTYGTLLASDGARHAVPAIPTVYLGSGVDTETDGAPTVAATGDDATGTDDEDGVTFQTSILPGQPYTIDVTASAAGYLNAWIDFDGNGTFGAGEQIAADLPLSAGVNTLNLTAPASATPFASTLFSRFRVSGSAGQVAGPTGLAPNGEVEDHALVQYLVTYDGNSNTDGTVPATQAKVQGVDLILATNSGALARTDYIFNGWNTQSDGNGTHYAVGETYAVDAALDLYAEWTSTAGYDFVITVKTDNPGTSGSMQFTIPTTGSGYNYNVDCDNDGSNEATAQTGDYTCTYTAAGTYTIRIKDNTGAGTGFPSIYFNNDGDRLKLLDIVQWGTGKWTSMNSAFNGCANMTMTATDAPDLSGVIDLSDMFRGASAFNGDISSWNTSSVVSMAGMFFDASAFNQDIGGWDTGNVLSMDGMFYNASAFNQDLNGWDTSKVSTMWGMFTHASAFNGDISSWNTASVTRMTFMFAYASSFNQDIGGWNTGNVTDMYDMFFTASAFNQDLNSWDTSQVTTMWGMFYNASAFNGNISSWNTANVTDMGYMFSGASVFNQDISSWNTANVTDMGYMFSGASVFNQDISGWDTGNVTDMSAMFRLANAFNQDLNSWDTSKVTTMYQMFILNSVFNGDISNWDTGSVTNMGYMFAGASAFNQDLSGWDTGSVTNMIWMFRNASAFNQDLGGWDVSALTNAAYMFTGVTLSTAHYDALLNGWDAQALQSGVTFSGGSSMYCTGEAARSNMMTADTWDITDGGKDPACHTVTYDGNGNTGGTVPTDSNNYPTGATVTVLDGGLTRTDYIFGGWNDGSNTYDPGDTFLMGTADVTLTALWADTTAPTVVIDSVLPNPTNAGTVVTWHADENGTYSVRVGGTDCTDGTVAGSGTYSTSPASVATSIVAGDLVPGVNTLRVCVTDAAANTGLTTDSVVRNNAPYFTSVAVTTGTQGAVYTYNVTTADPNTGDTLTITAPILPGWLTLTDHGDGTATLTGTPIHGDIGLNNVTLRVTDGMVSVDQSFTINVIDVNEAPYFTSTPVTSVMQDVLYTYNIVTADPDGDTLTITVPTRPVWLITFVDNGDGTATLSGLPHGTNVGPNSVTLNVSDGTTNVQQSFTIIVGDTNDIPMPNPATWSLSENSLNGTVVGTVTYNDPDVGQTHTFGIDFGNIGNAFAINVNTGVVTVNDATQLNYETLASYTLGVHVTDNGTPPLTGAGPIHINLTDVNEGTVVDITGAPSIPQDLPFTIALPAAAITVADADSNPVQITLSMTNGTLDLSTVAGLDFACSGCVGDGTGDATMTFQGSPANITAALANSIFHPTVGYTGPAALTVTVNDLGGNITVPASLAITVVATPRVVLGGNTNPQDGALLTAGVNKLRVQFNTDVLHGAPGNPNSADNPANYLLVQAGSNGVFNTTACGGTGGGLQPDDVPVLINSVSYDAVTFTATLNVYNGVLLPDGVYRLFVCGTTSITDPTGAYELNGGTADTVITFTISAADAIPSTGFAPDRVTALPEQTVSYTQSDLWLEIPKLGVQMDIVGVPQADGEWDVTWLGNNAGWLQGSAFPTWNGNSVITGHVWNADNTVGPFGYINTLWYGDQVIVHAGGASYVYEVRSVQQVGPGSTAQMLKHEELPWVTLVTCRGYDAATGAYKYRVLVRAVLVDVK